MFANRLRIFLSLVLTSAVGVSAQAPKLDPCTLNCINQAVANSTCLSFTDTSCLLSSSSFQETMSACIQAICTIQGQETSFRLRDQDIRRQVIVSASVTVIESVGPPVSGSASTSTSANTTSTPVSTVSSTTTSTASSLVTSIVARTQFSSAASTATPSASSVLRRTSHVGTIVGAVIGSITALGVMAIIIAFIWHRRRHNIRRSSVFANEEIVTVMTSFARNCLGMTRGDPTHRMEPQQQQTGLPETVQVTENADTDGPSPSSLPSGSGLYSQPPPSTPIGLSDKELARMRAEILHPPLTVNTSPVLGETQSQSRSRSRSPFPRSTPVAAAATEWNTGTSTPVRQALQSQFDRIWRAIEQLRTERTDSEAPPSYAERDASRQSQGMRSTVHSTV